MAQLKTILAWGLALALAGNGLAMLAGPEAWYHTLPTVLATGPFNPHFVRDIGAAYVTAAAALAWLALGRPGGRAAAATAAGFLALHALVHVGEVAAGTTPLAHLLQDLPAVGAAPVLAAWLAVTAAPR